MSATTIAVLCIAGLLILVLSGVHMVYALGVMSSIGICILSGGNISAGLSVLGLTSFSGIKEYTFTVIPLFILMGGFMGASGSARDLFDMVFYLLKRLPGGLAIATILSNAVFAAVTGASVASATVFAKISYPAMKKYRYQNSLALGSVAGSSVLGMLIPPSVLMIIYGMLSETSIGKLFLAGVVPGLVLALVYAFGTIFMCLRNPALCGKAKDESGKWMAQRIEGSEKGFLKVFVASAPIFLVIIIVLGGIWGGKFTPTEASAVGAMSTFIISLARGLRFKEIKNVLLESAGTIGPVMFLLITAKMYSRMLAMSGVTVKVGRMVAEAGMSEYVVLTMICLILLVMGCVLDSNSILLITVPLFLPIAALYDWNLIWLGIIMIVVVEMGLLTPPFGIVVFAMKATIGDEAKVEEIFKGAMPYMAMMIGVVILCVIFPELITWLPSLM